MVENLTPCAVTSWSSSARTDGTLDSTSSSRIRTSRAG
jgi:hypothetical protein